MNRACRQVSILVMLVVACAPAAGPSPNASASLTIVAATTVAATSGAPDKVFRSERYGYSLAVPGTWSMQQGPGEWPRGAQPQAGRPGVDAFADPYEFRSLLVVAVPVSAGTTFDAWSAEVAAITPSQCQTTASLPATVGGERALRMEIHCADGAYATKVAVVHNERGYLMAMVSSNADRELFAKLMDSVKFGN
jgi:hypothetical protein